MSESHKKTIQSLEEIMRCLADVWPSDRESIMKAGAQLEETIEEMAGKSKLLNDLIELAWKGLIHLYEKDDYFLSVKAASMQAINTIREFAIHEGDIAVEVFEKSCKDLEKAMAGEVEPVHETEESMEEGPDQPEPDGSDNQDHAVDHAGKAEDGTEERQEASKVQKSTADAGEAAEAEQDTTDAIEAVESDQNSADKGKADAAESERPALESEKSDERETETFSEMNLDDLASLVMQLSPENLTVFRIQQVAKLAAYLLEHAPEQQKMVLQKACNELNQYQDHIPAEPDAFLDRLGGWVEEAVQLEMESEVVTGPEKAPEQVPKGDQQQKGDIDKPETEPKAEQEQNPEPERGNDGPGKDTDEPKAEQEQNLVPKNDGDTGNDSDHDHQEQKAGEDPRSGSDTHGFEIPDDMDTALIPEYVTECVEQIEAAESALLDLETSPDDHDLINKVFRSFHTIKGTSAFMGLTPISEFAHAVETLLDMVRDGHLSHDSACADIMLSSIDIINNLLEEVNNLEDSNILMYPEEYASVMNVLVQISDFGKSPQEAMDGESLQRGEEAMKQSEVSAAGVDSSETTSRDASQPDPVPEVETTDGTTGENEEKGERTDSEGLAAPDPDYEASRESGKTGSVTESGESKAGEGQTGDTGDKDKEVTSGSGNGSLPVGDNGSAKKSDSGSSPGKKPGRGESEATVRVNMERLDRLIDMVGELVIAHSVVAQAPQISADPDLTRKFSHSTKILRELQDTSLTLRMVPLKATFNKMNRLVRDLAKKAGKAVSFSMAGEDTEIDRNMVDIINEPLVHLLRNALDHGIEDQQTRTDSGKPGIAKIWLRAFQAGGKVIIEIEDDGKGLDKSKILEKAASKGLIEPDKKLTENEIFKLIFQPGFSTADQVSDLSGRGVGMDVVNKSIDKLKGKVDVASKQGEGTKISLELPFTLAITDGMLVRIGDQQFIVPTINIDMTFRAREEDLFTMLGVSEQVSFRGDSIPVVRLHEIFGIPNAVENIMNATLLVVVNNKKKYALLVDEVIGQQQLVGKSINMPSNMKNVSGGAILGDGRVGLILDTVALLN